VNAPTTKKITSTEAFELANSLFDQGRDFPFVREALKTAGVEPFEAVQITLRARDSKDRTVKAEPVAVAVAVAPTLVSDGNVNGELTADSFFESELARLRAILNQKCEKYYDSEAAYVTISEWAEGLTQDVIIFNVEEEPMSEIFGRKVRVKNSGQGTDGVIVCYGIVGANLFFYDDKNKPLFYGLDHTHHPMRADYDTDEQYSEVVKQHNANENQQYERKKQLAGTLFVRWFDKDGRLMCQGWHDSDTLVSLE
jgi:hypothetical protein